MSRRSPLSRRRLRAPGIALASHTVGNALVVYPEDRITDEAKALALSVAPDAEHEMVVLDLPGGVPVSAWNSIADLLPRRRRGVRVIMGGRSRETVALTGQWLSERLGRTVVAPDGAVFPGTGGTLFVHSGKGSGWVRFRPGHAPEWEAKRFPRPSWDSGAIDPWPTSSLCVADPIPGGVWIHPAARDSATGGHWSRLVRGVPCQPEVLTVVLGCPGTPPVSLDDVSRFWRWLDSGLRERLRFVQYGPVRVPAGETLGQALADLLGTGVICYTGIPVGSPDAPEVYTLAADGGMGWRPFASELGYLPRTDPAFTGTPRMLAHRSPVAGAGLEQISPAVYWYTPDSVIEVVQSGLWVRPPRDAQNPEAVRARVWDAEAGVLAFDAGDEDRAQRMEMLARDVLARLDPATRARARLMPVSELGREAVRVAGLAGGELRAEPAQAAAGTVQLPSVPAVPRLTVSAEPVVPHVPAEVVAKVDAPAPVAASFIEAPPLAVALPVLDEPVAAGVREPVAGSESPGSGTFGSIADRLAPAAPEPAPEAPVEKAEPPAPPAETPVAPRFQPTPQPTASALVSGHDLVEERGWLRRTLSREFDAMAHSVSRILSEHPGFQTTSGSTPADVLTDIVAVRLYLSRQGESIDQALRTADNGPHVPFARCVVAGLTRLPSHRGATIFAASPTPAEWELLRRRRLITDWSFVHTLTEPSADQRGAVDVLLWSLTARRTKLIEPAGEDEVDNRVVFVPGTRFKVLEITEPGSDGTRGRILLRELAVSEVDESGRVDARQALDELAITSLQRCTDRWATAQPRGVVGEAARGRFGALPGLV
ncbi:hypothetical protein [Amycolatopsis sp. NPDC058986]|uniref:hypothetical protein n=1 Tax=unclassified Amycolatopsis TaxID=2618356 RepID=UPI00366F0CC2